jgi:hypothetical protein
MKWLVIFLLSLTAGANTETHEEIHWDKLELSKSPKDFKIPSQLWDLILKSELSAEEKKAAEKKQEEVKNEDKKEENPILVWMPAKVQLKASVAGILKSLRTELSFSMGGGEVDFGEFVTGEKGSFFVKILLDEYKDLSKLKVFFYSRAKKRKIDEDVFGSGCNVFFDVTKKFISLNSSEGIKVNVTEDRHLSVLGGHFIIANKSEGKIFLTQVSFVDSNKLEYFCQE